MTSCPLNVKLLLLLQTQLVTLNLNENGNLRVWKTKPTWMCQKKLQFLKWPQLTAETNCWYSRSWYKNQLYLISLFMITEQGAFTLTWIILKLYWIWPHSCVCGVVPFWRFFFNANIIGIIGLAVQLTRGGTDAVFLFFFPGLTSDPINWQTAAASWVALEDRAV